MSLVNTIDFAQMDQPTRTGDPHPSPDFKALYAAGFRVLILRRSYAYHDKTHNAFRLAHDYVYERDAQLARDAGFVVGAYMFPCFDKGAPSPKEQVANFVAAGGEVDPGVDLVPWLDVEFPGNGSADTGRTKNEIADLVDVYLDEFGDQLHVVAGIYTSHVQMHDSNGLGGVMSSDHVLKEHPLWQKVPYRLAAGNPLDQVAPHMPHEGRLATDPHDYWRTPAPWEGTSGYALVQTQGDVHGLPGTLHQADVGVFPSLRLGSTSSHVAWLRRRLGLDEKVRMFDGVMDRRVREIQNSRGLVVDGVIGPKTWSAIAWM